jgi:hypothetical protein
MRSRAIQLLIWQSTRSIDIAAMLDVVEALDAPSREIWATASPA